MSRYVALLRGINVGGKNSCADGAPPGRARGAGLCGRRHLHRERQRHPRRPTREPGRRQAADRGGPAPDASRCTTSGSGAPGRRRRSSRPSSTTGPTGFGSQPDRYHSDAIFLMGIDAAEARCGVRSRAMASTPSGRATGLIYSQRLSAKRTQSRLSRVMATPAYKSMTIRNWNTTTKLLAMLRARDASSGARPAPPSRRGVVTATGPRLRAGSAPPSACASRGSTSRTRPIRRRRARTRPRS